MTTVASGRWISDSGARGDRHRQEAERGHQRGHQHRLEPRPRALQDGLPQADPVFPQLVDRRDHHDPVQHRDAEQRDEADRRREVQVQAAHPQRGDAADQRERDVEDDEACLPDVAERDEQQQEDDRERQRDHDDQPLHGALLVLELAAPLQVIPRRAASTRPSSLRCASATKLPTSRPRTLRLHHEPPLAVLVVDRLGPADDGHARPRCPAGPARRRARSAAGPRAWPGRRGWHPGTGRRRRTAASRRGSRVAVAPPMAVSTSSRTCATFSP